ncbi:MAG: acyltransferase domain-containing protein [Nocardiaceae bacterium]|nr:acyltransferase domain-containing protein [Nocardiaceae bacterium]
MSKPHVSTVAEMKIWLRDWISKATGNPVEAIAEDRPMEEFGLASRDVLALAGDIEELTGVILTATVAYQHPTIASLATRIIEGETEPAAAPAQESYYTSNTRVDGHDIAIVGLATRFPGQVNTPDDMWRTLMEGRDAVTEVPEDRWVEFKADPALASRLAAIPTKGGFLDDIKGFDAEFFSMSPREVDHVDPQQRMALELTWEALEHAHIPASDLKGQRVGVFLGSSSSDYTLLAVADPLTAHPYAITGTASSILANRVSYFYDFRGPSVALDTACSSALVAVHQAVRSLRDGSSDVAVAGGVNILATPAGHLGFGELEILAPDGKIKAFSSDADGFNRSEGGGLVVLKRLEDAERDGDTILAVVAGSAVNQDGRSNGLTAPNPDAQVDVLHQAYRDAGIAPNSVDYVEAHGTGTLLGDPIEADALGRVIGRGRAKQKPMLLGAAKTNFGHLEAAAGAVGLIKVVLSMQGDKIPPTINFAGPNPLIPFEQTNLQIVDQARDWPRYSGKAIAGVSSFGFGGTNAHVVVREYVSRQPAVTETATDQPVVLVISASMPSRRRKAAEALANWMESEEGSTTPLADIGRTLAKRNHGRSRAAVVAATRAEAIAGLRALAAGRPGAGVFSADAPAAQGAIWVMSGFGAQHRKMAKQLYLENAIFKAAVDEVDEHMEFEAGYSVVEMFLDDSIDYVGVGTCQTAIFTIQVGLAALLRHHGAEPAAVIGHSQGEVAAAYISGGLSLEEAVRVIAVRSRLMGEGEAMIPEDQAWRMALVEYSAADIDTAIAEFPNLQVCVYAAPTHTVIGGPDAEVQAMVARAEALGKMSRVLLTKGAGHTSQMDALIGELAAELAGLEPLPLKTGLFSTVDREEYYRPGAEIHTVEYWVKNLRHSVWFTQAVRQAVTAGHTTFLELSPNPVALMQVAATTFAAGLHNAALIHTLKRKEDEPLGVLQALAQLYVHGHAVDVPSLFTPGPFANIPRTELIKRPFWIDVRINSSGSGRIPGAHVALPDGRHAWEVEVAAVTDLKALVVSAAAQVFHNVELGPFVSYAGLPATGSITTTLQRHPGGASVNVHAPVAGGFQLIFEAVLSAGEPLAAPQVSAISVPAQVQVEESEAELEEQFGAKWDPNGNQSLEDRLALIVAETMGYSIEDLPREIALLELGLDSLMAVRIKNRVEYEFDIPQLQLQAVRDANLIEVGKYLRYAVEHREEVAALAEQQAKQIADGGEVTAIELPDIAEETPAEQQPAETPSLSPDIPPRDAAERLTYATWAVVTGESAKGIFNELPKLTDEVAATLAERLSERAKGEITVADVLECTTIEQLSDKVRGFLEGGVDGILRTLRARPEGSTAVPVFMFHPAGGSTVVYEPLLRRLPEGTPMYGLERVDGESLEERARQYLPKLREIQGDGPYVLAGWSLGGAFAFAVANLLKAEGADVRLVAMLDVALPADNPDDTPEEVRARWHRYSEFAKRTYGIDGLPDELIEVLAEASDEEQIEMLLQMVEFSGIQIPSGVLEHQKTSWIDNRHLMKVKPIPYDGEVVLYLADKYHDDAIALEPRYGARAPKGGWGEVVPNLEVVEIGGDHLQIVDEPYISKVGAHLSKKLTGLQGQGG